MLKKKFFKTKNEAEVTFEFAAENSKTVALVADFNKWEPVEMRFVKKDKVFRTRVRLPKDELFCFRYLLDNTEWQNDYKADNYLPNPFGTDNSVVSTQVA